MKGSFYPMKTFELPRDNTSLMLKKVEVGKRSVAGFQFMATVTMLPTHTKENLIEDC